MKTSFVCAPFAENSDGIYYHGFKVQGKVFSALNYCAFKEEQSGELFFGKIQSIFHDKKTNLPMAEVSVFQYVPETQKRTNSSEYNELWAVMNETIEIPLSSIESKEVSLVHVPATVTDVDLLTYVDDNIGKTEHEEDDSDDEDSDDDMSDFIVKGEVFGFYQYAVDDDDTVHYAPPPKFADKFMSFETTDDDAKMTHEFVEHVKNRYIAPKLVCMTNREPFENDDEIIQLLLTQQYVTHDDSFFFMKDQQEVRVECDLAKTQRLSAFVFLLKTMLTQVPLPAVSDMYSFCLQFELTV